MSAGAFRFKIDENLPDEVADSLRNAGHEASTVYAQGHGGTADEHLGQFCLGEKRALVTLDLDFADNRRYPPKQYQGLIVLRVGSQDKRHVLGVFGHVIPMIGKEPLAGHLWIVEEQRVRIRDC